MVASSDPTTDRAMARVGLLLSKKWCLDKLIGVGGMAAVYAATHRNGAHVAVKMLHPAFSDDANVRGRFLREGYAGNSIEHRGVVMVLDDDVADDGAAFLVMELLNGESLERRRERHGGVLEAGEVLSVSDQLLDVLVAAHAKGVVHRDLKPDNIFLTVDGVVKVLDFGIAKLKQQSQASNATRIGSAMGTPGFMCPEQARGRWDYVDGQSDLWAVGATMFTLLTGRMVHEAETVQEQMLLAMTSHCQSLSTYGQFPADLVHIVDRALLYEKTQRWPDAATMQEAVRQAYYGVFSMPIAESPKLAAPPSAYPPAAGTIAAEPTPNAMVSAGAGSTPNARVALTTPMVSTGIAMSTGQTGVELEAPRSKFRAWMLAPVGVVALVLAGAALLVFRGGSTPSDGAAISGPASATGTAPPTASAEVPTPSSQAKEPGAIDINALPVANDPPKDRNPATSDAGVMKPPQDAGRPVAPVPVTGKKAGPVSSKDSLDKWK